MRLITDILREIRRGAAVQLASEKLAEVVRAVQDTGGKGEVSMILKVEPDKGGVYTFTPVVKAKIPIPDLGTGIFFLNEDGEPVRDDPRQEPMFRDAEEVARTG